MHLLFLLAANGMAAFMDFGVGCVIAALVAKLFAVEPTLQHLVVGGIMALIPDLDVVVPIATKMSGRKISDHHVSLLHRPLIMVPALTATALWIGGGYWAVVMCACLMSHYIHDTPPLGDAPLNWLGPWWGKDLLPPQEHWQWINKKWLRPSLRSVYELSIGILALAGALLAAQHTNLAAMALVLMPMGVIVFWLLAGHLKIKL